MVTEQNEKNKFSKYGNDSVAMCITDKFRIVSFSFMVKQYFPFHRWIQEWASTPYSKFLQRKNIIIIIIIIFIRLAQKEIQWLRVFAICTMLTDMQK